MVDKKIKIAFILPSLGAGGAERIMSFIAQNINIVRFQPILVVISNPENTSYEIQGVQTFYLNKSRVLFSVFSIMSFFRKHKPNLVMSSVVHLNAMVALISVWFPKIQFIGREASVLTEMGHFESSKWLRIQKLIIKFSYRFLDVIICQSKDMAQDLIKNFKVSPQKIKLINNPITRVTKLKEINTPNSPIRFISVSRLSKEKGLDRMVFILSQLDFPFQFTLIGNGPEKETIFKQLKEHGLLEKTNHIPFTKDVDRFLSESDVFLQTSYVDGFPNAVVESCSVGTPVVAINAPGGISEIIDNGKNGYIVQTKDDFIGCLNAINKKYTFNPEVVRGVVTKRFNKNVIMKKYEDVFSELNSQKNG